VPPKIDPDRAGADAIAKYDANHDGCLSGAELDKCPALKQAMDRIDTEKDGKITAGSARGRTRASP
jgi:hypothetical protein